MEKQDFHIVDDSDGLNEVKTATPTAGEHADHLQQHNLTEKKYCINSGYILREIAGEYVIVPVNEECVISNAVMTPNETAVFLWKAFQTPNTPEDVIQKVLEEYDAEESMIRNAVYSFLEDTLKYEIVEEV